MGGGSSSLNVEPKNYAIAVDFGTTYSRAAVWNGNRVDIIENEYGSRLTSSTVAFTDTGRLIIGDTAHMEQANAASTVPSMAPITLRDIKSLIGRCYSDRSVHADSNFLPFRVIRGDKNRSMVSVHYKNEEKLFAPEEIAAMILSKMKNIAEAHLKSEVSKAVISVPPSFNDSQRRAIKDAGAIAGLDVLQLLNGTTAAAIGFFLQNNSNQKSSKKTLLIFHLGGGTLDVSIAVIEESTIKIRAAYGDTNLGGEDFDDNMVSHFIRKFANETRRDIRNKPRSLGRLRAACEKAKRVLSTNARTMVEVDALDEGINFRSVITRKEFEKLNDVLFKKCISCVKRCLKDASIDTGGIDEVVLVGGSTRIPKIQLLLQELFNGKELFKSIHADEAVVSGAAVQAAILSGNEDRKKFNILKLEDVTSWSFGLETKDGTLLNLLIPKQSPIPTSTILCFTTCSDNQSSFLIQVQECELEIMNVFALSNIPPKPRGHSNIKVLFEVDNSGILHLTAVDYSTQEMDMIAVSKETGGLTTEEIQEMVRTLAHYKAEDEERKAWDAASNYLENLANLVKVMVRRVRAPAAYKKPIEGLAIQAFALLEANPSVDIDEINNWKLKLETIKIALEDNDRIAALNSIANLVHKIKKIANDPGVSATSKNSMEIAANDAIICMETNLCATIDEINGWKNRLEIISNQIVYLGSGSGSPPPLLSPPTAQP